MHRATDFLTKIGVGLFTLAGVLLTVAMANAESDFRKSYSGKCIGGDRCGGRDNVMIIRLKHSLRVQRIEFYADDNIGDSANGKVSVFVDGEPVARSIDIKRKGSLHTIDTDRFAREILIEPAGDDETSIHKVTVYGISHPPKYPRRMDYDYWKKSHPKHKKAD